MFAFYADILKVKRIIYPKFLKRQGTSPSTRCHVMQTG